MSRFKFPKMCQDNLCARPKAPEAALAAEKTYVLSAAKTSVVSAKTGRKTVLGMSLCAGNLKK